MSMLELSIVVSVSVPVTFKLVYMVLFNLFQTVGFIYIIVVLLYKLIRHGDG